MEFKTVLPGLISLVLMALFVVAGLNLAETATLAPEDSLFQVVPALCAVICLIGMVVSGLRLIIWLFDEVGS